MTDFRTDQDTPPELSRIVNCAELGQHAHRERIVASPVERAALAKRFDIDALDRLEAEITVSRQAGALFRVEGRLNAIYRQTCVVTLEPIETVVAEPFTLLYSPRPDGAPAGEGGEIVLESEADDWPEPILADQIDLGEAVAQQLALTIDPYPRKPGAALPAVAEDVDPASTPTRASSIKSLMDKAFQEAGKSPAKKR